MEDGHLNKCKECNKKDVKENYRKNIKHYTEYEIARSRTEKRMKLNRELSRKLRKSDPERVKRYNKKYNETKRGVANILNRSVREGKIIKKPCQICGNEISQGHHFDYSRPLSVIWLCKDHHSMAHRKHDPIDISHLIKELESETKN